MGAIRINSPAEGASRGDRTAGIAFIVRGSVLFALAIAAAEYRGILIKRRQVDNNVDIGLSLSMDFGVLPRCVLPGHAVQNACAPRSSAVAAAQGRERAALGGEISPTHRTIMPWAWQAPAARMSGFSLSHSCDCPEHSAIACMT